MGLKIDKTLDSGITLQGAYVKITNINGNKDILDLSVCVYVSYQACRDGKTPVDYVNYKFTPSVVQGAENFLKQGYMHLKTLEEFKGSLDVFEPDQF
ncbi:hypothetical protein [Bacillus thuringiensis]|uniref:hypothetical protein n=1 Tax=Bacillus thuringiensis TaxID=1428 RepID=UPI001CFB5CD9|nr:hypothetical protein [Bacillus thuringiensis]